ncbi:MAG TPA: HlyD family efflux transporter periplasmic adaptor subunit [Phaeodactylibacter sp.]|nr:HlyD family efflux transporter periplasmic adaptor subunit [Phaeodactylibacter sp.]
MFRFILLTITILLLFSCKEKQDLSDGYGNFEATVYTISSEANGRLIFLDIEEGQTVKKGKLIGLVDTTQLDLQRKQIKAKINTLPKKLRNTLADIEVLQNQKSNIVREQNRVLKLLEKKAATPKQLDDINGQIEVVDKKIAAIRAQTKIANRSILAEKEPLIAQMAIINNQIEKAYLHNPITGTVLTKLTEPNEVVRMGTPLYRIGQLDTMTLRFYASSLQLQQVKLGQKIEVLIDNGVDNYTSMEGVVTWISAQSEFTPKTIQTKEDRVNLVYAVKATVPNPDGVLKIGMPAEVNFNHNNTSTKTEE